MKQMKQSKAVPGLIYTIIFYYEEEIIMSLEIVLLLQVFVEKDTFDKRSSGNFPQLSNDHYTLN